MPKDDEYASRATRLFESLPVHVDTVFVPTNRISIASRDIEHPFRPNSNMLYLCGCTEEARVLVLSRKRKSQRVLLTLEEFERFSAPIDAKRAAISMEEATFDPNTDRLHKTLDHYRLHSMDCTAVIHRLRLIKSASELSKIRLACRATALAMREVQESSIESADETETTLAARFRLSLAKLGVDCCAFPTIVAFDENAIELHHTPTHKRMGRRILVDAGATFDFYSADMSRSWQVGNDPRFEWMHGVVSEAQEAAIAACVPGSTHDRLEKVARKVLEERCRERKDVDAHCPHYISHWLGLDVHDVGKRSTVFERDMVVAVEPGLYVQSIGIGIRIEDTVRVDNVPEVLTSTCDTVAQLRADRLCALDAQT